MTRPFFSSTALWCKRAIAIPPASASSELDDKVNVKITHLPFLYSYSVGFFCCKCLIIHHLIYPDEDIAPGVGIFKIISNDKANVEMIR